MWADIEKETGLNHLSKCPSSRELIVRAASKGEKTSAGGSHNGANDSDVDSEATVESESGSDSGVEDADDMTDAPECTTSGGRNAYLYYNACQATIR